MQQDRFVGEERSERVPVSARPGQLAAVCSEYSLAGVDWSYYNKFTHVLQYTYNHPGGFVGHFAWQGEAAWRVLNLWRDEALRERFFAEEAAERIARGIHLLGAVSVGDDVTDIASTQRSVVGFVLGPQAAAFSAPGEDRDGSAIRAIGTDPVALELEVPGMLPGDYENLLGWLGYETSVPAELISHLATVEPDGIRIFETWSDGRFASAELMRTLGPAIERLGRELEREFLTVHREYALSRIALSASAVSAFVD